MLKTTMIANGKFKIVSFNHGEAYEFRNESLNKSVFLEGKDAKQFVEEMEHFEKSHPHRDVLAFLWSIYGDMPQKAGWVEGESLNVMTKPEYKSFKEFLRGANKDIFNFLNKNRENDR